MSGKGRRIAIVTGASSGLGVEFAKQVDVSYELDEIWLVARREEKLRNTAGMLKKAKPVVLPLDLSKRESIKTISEMLDETKADVRVLINNAGFAKKGDFWEISLEKQLTMVDLNVRAMVHLCHICVPHMTRGAHIVNVASMAAFFVLKSMTTYGATKAFVLHYTYGLRKSLSKKGIHVTCCAPGPVKTEFFLVATEGKEDDMVLSVEPEGVVALALRDVASNKKLSIFSGAMRTGYLFRRYDPKDEED